MATDELMAVAYVRPKDGKEPETISVLRELYTLMRRKDYSRDLLYRDPKDYGRLVNLRHWTSGEARDEAHEDPEVHRLWQRLSEVSQVEDVTKSLEIIESTMWSKG